MSLKAVEELIKKRPELENLAQGAILYGYTNGAKRGEKTQVFLLRSFLGQYCVTGIAQESLEPGGVISLNSGLFCSNDAYWLIYNA